ncbi:hypothetical protein [Hydrogenimonas sp.]
MKDLRNQIAHEYEEEALAELFDEVLLLAPELVEMLERAASYLTHLIDYTGSQPQ